MTILPYRSCLGQANKCGLTNVRLDMVLSVLITGVVTKSLEIGEAHVEAKNKMIGKSNLTTTIRGDILIGKTLLSLLSRVGISTYTVIPKGIALKLLGIGHSSKVTIFPLPLTHEVTKQAD